MNGPRKINWQEVLDYYGYKGRIGSFKLKLRLFKSWFLQLLASICPWPELTVALQRARGVKIGRNVFIGPNMFIDLVYPHLVTIEDYASMGYSMIFTHANPVYSIYIKKYHYPRKVAPVRIQRGSVIFPGAIILCGVTIGENSIIGAGSVVTSNVEPYTVVAGVPAKEVKKLKSNKD